MLAAVAARQHGVLKLAQLRAAGLSPSAVSKRVARGALHRVHRAVYAYGHAALSREGVWLAAVYAGGDGAVLADLSCAALLLDVSRFGLGRPDVLVPRHHRPVPGVQIRTCRRLDPRDVTVCRGIPVTTVARLLVDLTDLLTPHQLAWVIGEAAYKRRFSLPATRQAMARANGRRRLKVLERAIELYLSGSAGTRSPHEDAFLALVDGVLPEPLVNTRLATFEVDFLWPEAMLAVEIDGGGHDRPPARRRDELENRVLTAAGYTVMRFTDRQVQSAPADVLAQVTAAFAQADARRRTAALAPPPVALGRAPAAGGRGGA